MPVSTINHHKSGIRCAIASQAAWGTANTTQAQFYELHVTDIVKIDASSGMVEDATKRSDGSRVETITDIYRNAAGGEYTAQVSGIATIETLAMLIYGVTQDLASEVDGTIETKIFELDEQTTQKIAATGLPNYLLTFLLADPISAENKQLHTCVVKSLQVESDPGANAGRMAFTATIYTGFPVVATGITATPAEWVAPSQNFLVHQLLQTKTVGSVACVVSKYSLSIESEVARSGYSTAGAPEFYSFGMPKVSGSTDIKYDNQTCDLPDAFFLNPSAAGAADFAVTMIWGSASAVGYLKLDVWAVYAGDPWDRPDNAGTLFMTVPFRGVCIPGSVEAIEITLADGVARAWIA